jgi:hypothetical protein
MNITPCLGIGDLLILKMTQLSNNLVINNININNNLIISHCENYDQKIKTIIKMIELLFPNISYCINDSPLNFLSFINTYKIKQTYIYDDINISNLINIKNEYSDYIIFHTKLRHDTLMTRFREEIMDRLKYFLSNFASSKKILLLGERTIGQNFETILHGTTHLYDILLLLKNNNCVIDLTHDVLTCGNPDFNVFLSDIQLIHNASCNITFGIGGPLSICKAFSKNNISFIPFYNSCPGKNIIDQMNIIDNTIVDNMDDFKNRLETDFGANNEE